MEQTQTYERERERKKTANSYNPNETVQLFASFYSSSFSRIIQFVHNSIEFHSIRSNNKKITVSVAQRNAVLNFSICVDKKTIRRIYFLLMCLSDCAPIVSLRTGKKSIAHTVTLDAVGRCRRRCCCCNVYFALSNLYHRIIHNAKCNTLIKCMWLVKRQSYQ